MKLYILYGLARSTVLFMPVVHLTDPIVFTDELECQGRHQALVSYYKHRDMLFIGDCYPIVATYEEQGR